MTSTRGTTDGSIVDGKTILLLQWAALRGDRGRDGWSSLVRPDDRGSRS